MAMTLCGFCTKAVEPDDYYRELDCSRSCENNVFHEFCIERYLRKQGREVGAKCGYGCPGVLSNGKQCSGTIRKTHYRLPANIKKKAQTRQAAITANEIINAARAVATTVPMSARKGDGEERVSKIANPKSTNITILRRSMLSGDALQRIPGARTFQCDEGVNDLEDNAWERARNPLRPRYGDSTSDPRADTSRFTKPSSNKISLLHTAHEKTRTSLALSNNIAMAPEPVVRQRVLPSWVSAVKAPSSASSLQQQRDLVAELRAKEKMPSANRATTSLTVAIRREGRDAPKVEAGTGAGGTGTGEVADDTATAQGPECSHMLSDWLMDELDKGEGELTVAWERSPSPSLVTGPVTPAAGKLQEPSLYRSESGGYDVFGTTAPGFISPTEPQQVMEAPDADPIVQYDQLFSTEDGTLIVLDKQSGFFLRMEDVYGQSPEMIGFQDDAGNVTYYVVVRAAVQWTQQQRAAAAAAALECARVLTNGEGGVMSKAADDSSTADKPPMSVAAEDKVMADNPVCDATSLELDEDIPQDEEEELNYLLSLCLA